MLNLYQLQIWHINNCKFFNFFIFNHFFTLVVPYVCPRTGDDEKRVMKQGYLTTDLGFMSPAL